MVKFSYPERSWAEGKMRKKGDRVAGGTPDMTGWDPKYIKEYLEGKEKSFQANEKVNRDLNKLPVDDSKVREQMSPRNQIRYLDQKGKRSDVGVPMQMAKMDRLQRGLPGEGGQLAEIDRAAGMGVAARGGPTGTMQVPAAVVPTQRIASDAIAQHKDYLKEGLNQVAQGDMTPDALKKMMKQFGWTGDVDKGEFLDPNGTPHRIEAEAK